MADLIIRGMEMPEPGQSLLVAQNWDGSIYARLEPNGNFCPLVPLPEGHGRLVDAREVLEKADKSPWFDGDVAELGLLLGSEVTTIVPAEGGGEDG
jgi:hypothetical protein